jgi:hypothetical protein
METDKLISTFIKLRDAKSALKAEYDEKLNEIQEKMDLIEQEVLELVNSTGVESLKTKSGTAYRSVKTRYWIPDWSAFRDFLEEYGDVDLLEHRIHQTNFKSFLEENPDLKPPVNVDSRYSIVIRRGN